MVGQAARGNVVEATTTMGLEKGMEVPDCQVTDIPEGIRIHPYKRGHLPTLEILLLWEDTSCVTRGHCLYTIAHPSTPSMEQVDQIFDEVKPYFAKRWLIVELCLAPPIRGEFEEIDGTERRPHDTYVGAGVSLVVLACHAYGFARTGAAAHVTECQPIKFRGISDDAGKVKLCFLPAEINKVQVAETEMFHGHETVLLRENIRSLSEGPTILSVELTPKAFASMTVHVFAMPARLPKAEETAGIIDWAGEEREELPGARVVVQSLKDGAATIQLREEDTGIFSIRDGCLPEGCVTLVASCPGYSAEERTVMLLVGANEFYVPLHKD